MNYELLYQWEKLLSDRLPSLNSWQVANVALLSYGVIQAESCQQRQVAQAISCGEAVESAARRWRRFLGNEHLKLDRFFGEWSRWVISSLGQKAITLVVDETKIGDKMAALVVGVAWEGRCLPLAWRTYRANSHSDYPAEGQVKLIEDLLKAIKAGLDGSLEVLVLADRGIGCSPELCKAVTALEWCYLFRVTCQTKIITQAGALTIAQQVQPGEIWAASGRIFKRRGRLPAHARALWSVGYAEPWALVTNDDRLTGQEYARRNWCEQSFRDLKSGGWLWGRSRIRQPDHTARLLLLLVLAYVWTVALGSQAVHQSRAQPLLKRADGSRRRLWSLFREGLRFFVEVLQRHTRCFGLIFIPDHRFG
jgi:hypothetical protein